MRTYLMTRGFPRKLDYGFIGAAPDYWWKPVGQWVLEEKPGVVVTGGADGLRMVVFGVPSDRRDSTGTAVRHTLVLDGLREVDLATDLVSAALTEAGRAELGRAVDGEFAVEEVDAALRGDPVDEPALAARVETVLRRAVGGAGDAGPDSPPVDTGGTWAGSADDADAVAGFVARVTALADGGPGWAFTSTRTTTDHVEEAARHLDAPVAALLPARALDRVVRLGKADPAGRAGVLRPPVLVGLLTVLVLLVLLAVIVRYWVR